MRADVRGYCSRTTNGWLHSLLRPPCSDPRIPSCLTLQLGVILPR